MRRSVLAVAMVATILALPASSQTFEIGPGGGRFGPGERGGGNCEELRRACEMKDVLGEVGQGNCRRYRETCLRRRVREVSCEDLRRACLFKEEMGEVGGGNCRRYRALCRGGF